MTDTASHRRPTARPMPAGISVAAADATISDSYGRSTCGPAAGSRRPARLALVAGALLLALAGCESTPSEPPAAAAEEPAATATQTQAQTGTPPAGGEVVEERLTTADCATPSQDRVHFRINQVVFAVPGDDVRTVVPPGVTPQTPAAEVVDRLRASTAEGAGCPEKPLDAALLGVAGPAGDPLLADTIALFQSPPGAISGPYGDLTRQMLANPDRCQTAEGGGLLACQAVERDGGQETQSLYLVSTERNRTLAFGGPLAARCVVVNEQIRGCEIVDELAGGIGMRVPLRALPQSGPALAAAHEAALAQVRAIRR